MTRVAVTGAAGKTGRAVAAALRARGVDVLPLVRGVVDLDTGAGLELLHGCSALYLVAPNVHPDEPALVQRVLDAAADGGVGHIVYHSVAQPYSPSMPHHVDKAVAEDLVRRSGLAWTLLQPCAYTQNLLDQLRADLPRLVVPYDVDQPFSFVDLLDVADAAAVVLTEPRHVGATYELGGPQALTVREVGERAAAVLGRSVEVASITPADWAVGPGAGLSDDARRRLTAMFDYYDRHGLLAGSLALEALLGRRPTAVQDVLARELSGGS